MSMSEDIRVKVEVEFFHPEINEANNGKYFIIDMNYRKEYDHDDRVDDKRMIFRLNWEVLDVSTLVNDHNTTVFDWLNKLEVDDIAWDIVVDQTLLALKDLLLKMVNGNLRQPSFLGVKVTIMVCEDRNTMEETEPDYYESEDESLVEYVTYTNHDQPVYESVQGENNNTVEPEPEPEPEPESEPDYFSEDEADAYPEAMDIEEENQEVRKNALEAATMALACSGVNFFKIHQVYPLVIDTCCPICLEEFEGNHDEDMKEDTEEVAVLPCRHVLHTHCLVDWYLQGRGGDPSCPLCRYQLQLLVS